MLIDNLQAGRETDALIAEKVFGWEDASWDCECHCYTGHPKERYRYEQVPHYSTDIAAAREVSKKIAYMGVDTQQQFIIQLQLDLMGGGLYPLGLINASPLAICRAALKALGVS